MPFSRPSRSKLPRLRFESLEPRLTMDAGDLDLTFGAGGQVDVPIYGRAPNDYPVDVAAQSDGKIVVLGNSRLGAISYNAPGLRPIVTRLLSDGQVDTSFADNGRSVLPINIVSGASDLQVLTDGKILVCGMTASRPFVARLTEDGALDATFGSGGIAIIAGSDIINYSSSFQLGIQSDGKIVLAGGEGGIYLKRLLSNGEVDDTFSPPYIRDSLIVFGAVGGAFNLRVVAGDKILLSQYGNADLRQTGYLSAIRLLPNGQRDTTFAGGGSWSTEFANTYDTHEAPYSAEQEDGSLLFAITTFDFDKKRIRVARLNSDGTLDSDFGVQGIATLSQNNVIIVGGLAVESNDQITLLSLTFNYALHRNEVGLLELSSAGQILQNVESQQTVPDAYFDRASLVQAGGQFVAVYKSYVAQQTDIGVTRWNVDHLIDTTFGSHGSVLLNSYPSASQVNAATQSYSQATAILADGRMLVGGSAGESPAPFLARFLKDGALDASYGVGGILAFEGYRSPARFFLEGGIAVGADGGAVIVGVTKEDGVALEVRSLDGQGNANSLFGIAGTIRIPLQNSQPISARVLIQVDKKIVVVVNHSTFPTGTESFVFRFNSNGELDISYGIGGILELPQITSDIIDAKLDGERLVLLSRSGEIARLLSNGAGDRSFSSQGVALPTHESWQQPFLLLVKPTHDIVVGYQTNIPGMPIVLSQLTAGGALDEAFGASGYARIEAALSVRTLRSISLDYDGGLLIATIKRTTSLNRTELIRLFSDGVVDTAFGDQGFAIFPKPQFNDYPSDIVFAGEDLLVVGAVDTRTTTNLQLRKVELDRPTNLWQNAANPLNASGDAAQAITPLDALVVINEINRNGLRRLGFSGHVAERPTTFVDVNGDGQVTPLDALIVINWLNAHETTQLSLVDQALGASVNPESALAASQAEGESAVAADPIDAALMSYFWEDQLTTSGRRRR